METRRTFLQRAALLAFGSLSWRSEFLWAAVSKTSPDFAPDLDVALTASTGAADLLLGEPTRVWSYRGQVLSGEPASLQDSGSSYLGPTFRVRKGQKVRIRFRNEIPEVSIIHWHGLIVPPRMDGHPRDVIDTGQEYVYEFEVPNRAGTYWYHPHPHRRTGPQVYYGLAGFFLVADEEEEAAGLPTGEFDLPLVIQDRTFDDTNQLVYLTGRGDQLRGFLGNRILVNGRPNYTLAAATRVYRLRLLNGSNSRIYRLAWSDGRPLTVLATDGGLLERPVVRSSVLLAPGERIELWADFTGMPTGAEVKLVSLPIPEIQSFWGGRRGSWQGRANGEPLTILTVKIASQEEESLVLPASLSTIERYDSSQAVNASNPRLFQLLMQHMTWTINGRVFEMEAVTSQETVRQGDLEMWEFANPWMGMGMMGMMNMPHPMHLHGVQFQVAGRLGSPYPEDYVDEGWKDTVLVMPGERVRILIRFEDFRGLYLYHCHNLEHEDMGMMRNYLIE